LLVKTTIDLPEEILHRAKIVAAQRKTTLKELVIAGLTHALDTPPESENTKRRERAARLISALSKGRNTEPVGPLNRDDLYDRHQLF
jgi:hypothetical protein